MITEIKDRADPDAGLISYEQIKLFVDRMLSNSRFNDEYVAADKDYEKKVPIGRYLLQLEFWMRQSRANRVDNDISSVLNEMKELSEQLNIPIEPGSKSEGMVGRELLRAEADYYEETARRERKERGLPDSSPLAALGLKELEAKVHAAWQIELGRKSPEETIESAASAQEQAAAPKISLSKYGEKFVSENERHKRFNKSTAAQARQTFALFGKSLGHDDLSVIKQTDLSTFKDLLDGVSKNYGKSKKDKKLSAEELLAKGAAVPPEMRGLGVDATNRHLNFLSQVFRAIRSRGQVLDSSLDPAALRAKESTDPMDEVLPWTQEQRRLLYAQPPFNGCKGPKHRMVPGDLVFHDGLYWCPIICDYLGLRREEAAGLAVADVMLDEDTAVWTIDVRPNQFRDLKRTWTARRLPIPEEILRLRFLDYVEKIRALGYQALFPDLLSAVEGRPLGEQLADGWAKVESGAFPDGKPEKTAFRSYRHAFTKDLKDAGVWLEMRKELMGHKKVGETEGRYGDRFAIRPKAEAISKHPKLTDKLESYEINLLPSISKL
jgi:integrase